MLRSVPARSRRCWRPDQITTIPATIERFAFMWPASAACSTISTYCLALGATPAQAAPLLAGKRDGPNVVAFPLLAVKGQAPASAGVHVSHSSHVSGSGGHASHVSHSSHVSSVPVPAPTSAAPVAPQQPPPASPGPVASANLGGSPAASANLGGSPSAAPASGSLASSSVDLGSGSPAASKGGGCAFVIVAPFSALMGWIRRLARRGRTR